MTKYDTTPYIPAQDAGENPIPFVYLGGKYVLTGNQYDASPIAGDAVGDGRVLHDLGHQRHLKGAWRRRPGYLVGDLCVLTHNQPASRLFAGAVRAQGHHHVVGDEPQGQFRADHGQDRPPRPS